jgi:histidine triad (HIT) family protein
MLYSGNDFYCDVVFAGKIEIKKEFESESVLAFHHTDPSYPVHIVVVPKKHVNSLTSQNLGDEDVFIEVVRVVQKVAKKIECEYGAAKVVTNVGTYQDSKHLHFHVIFGEKFSKKQ